MEEIIKEIIEKPQPNKFEMCCEVWQTAQSEIVDELKFLKEEFER